MRAELVNKLRGRRVLRRTRHFASILLEGGKHAQRPATQQSRETQGAEAKGAQGAPIAVFRPARELQVTAVVVPKRRGRLVTGWRQAPPPTRPPKWKKPVAPEPPAKTG